MIYLRNIPPKHYKGELPAGTVRVDEFKDNPGVYYAYLPSGEHIPLSASGEAESDDFSPEQGVR